MDPLRIRLDNLTTVSVSFILLGNGGTGFLPVWFYHKEEYVPQDKEQNSFLGYRERQIIKSPKQVYSVILNDHRKLGGQTWGFLMTFETAKIQ